MEFNQNNLAQSESPYLRQHADNPVWWQVWSDDVWRHAAERNRPVLVSVGYSTCHWCHVMASEAFSDPECAQLINENFVAIKVDREQRPDIDHYLMSFLVATTGSGGWPLNAFLTSDRRPFFAMTYAATEPRYQIPAFSDILRQVTKFHDTRADEVERFDLSETHSATDAPGDGKTVEAHVVELAESFDSAYGGFGEAQKFPPHSTLHYMLHAFASTGSVELKTMIRKTMDTMMLRGLHDHLQGGFFRYCVDRQWTIPHFEKMLYDQAMLLWNYSLAARLFDSREYREVARSIIRCLDDSFASGDLFVSAHDADTDHHEGATYIWSRDEIQRLLTPEEFEAFCHAYVVTAAGNFEGENHLVRSARDLQTEDGQERSALKAAEQKLLFERRRRPQPSVDQKVIVAWNALLGCALLAAERHGGIDGAAARAERIAEALLTEFVVPGSDKRLGHAVFEGKLQDNQFLSDTAALLLLLSYLDEDGGGRVKANSWLEQSLATFTRDGTWYDAQHDDFLPVVADPFDQPVPSGISVAELFLARQEVVGSDYHERPYRDPIPTAFRNIAALLTRGEFYIVESPKEVDWRDMPVNSMRMTGTHLTSCYHGVCQVGLPVLRSML